MHARKIRCSYAAHLLEVYCCYFVCRTACSLLAIAKFLVKISCSQVWIQTNGRTDRGHNVSACQCGNVGDVKTRIGA